MNAFFGKRWDAPAFDDAEEIEVPLGAVDQLCGELIDEGDSGTVMLGLGPVHIECWLRMGLGSPAHVLGVCSCTGREEPMDARSWRQQGREVMRIVRRDWIGDPGLSAEEKLERFEGLDPKPTRGPKD